jgi:hypothetical protein
MKNNKIIKLSFAFLGLLFLIACSGEVATNLPPSIDGVLDQTVEVGSQVDFLNGVTALDPEDGDLTASIKVDSSLVDLETAGTYSVTYSVSDSEGLSSEVTATITVTSKAELSDEEKVKEDLEAFRLWFQNNPGKVDFIKRGEVHRSLVSWKSNSPYLSNDGVLLPLPYGKESSTASYTVTFKIRSASVSETFEVDLSPVEPVIIESSRVVPFQNTTTEFSVEDGQLTLYFEEGGYVPYVKVQDFFALLEGFIDPELEMTVTTAGNVLTLFYEYYDEDEEETYDLQLVIDAEANTLTTNDPGFYWAYIYSTETNFGRHIEYDYDNPDAHYLEGSDVVYDLNKFNLDIVVHENEIVMPFYIVNQLFAGSSYYNVYYNNDGLYGIYGTPADDSDEYLEMKTSDMNGEDFPNDLVVHNFNVLAFNLEYFYGLKELLEVDNFYDLMYPLGSRLLSKDPATFDLALRELLLKSIDEPHTSYNYPGYFNDPTDEGPPTNNLSYYGPRFQKWYYDGFLDVDDAIGEKWGEAGGNSWNANSGLRPDFWFLDESKDSVVITLNGFNTSDIDESENFDHSVVSDILKISGTNLLPSIPSTFKSSTSKFFYYNESDNDYRQVNILIKGYTQEVLEEYSSELANLGFTFESEETNIESKKDGYFSYQFDDITYMVQLAYDTENSLFHIGVSNEVPDSYFSDWPFEVDIKELIEGDSAVYLELVFDKIMFESPNLKNAMLDLTWNTGGNVGALYRVIGFITSQPFMVSRISGASGSASSSYVYIDGVPVYENLNWALLTSPLTFSAANSMATIFKTNNLGKVIGLKSGGGASSITPILLPSGTSFTMSSNSINATRSGSGTDEDPYIYENNEYGIEPDILIDIEKLYDEITLLTAFN